LLDLSGNVVGIVVSKLDALKTADVTGDLPQNVNFAIKGSIARSFLDANNVAYRTGASGAPLDPTQIAARAGGSLCRSNAGDELANRDRHGRGKSPSMTQ